MAPGTHSLVPIAGRWAPPHMLWRGIHHPTELGSLHGMCWPKLLFNALLVIPFSSASLVIGDGSGSRSLLFSKESKLLPQVGRPAQELSVLDVTCLVTCYVSFGERTSPRRGGTRSGFNGTAGQHHHVMIDPLFCCASTAA